MELAAELNREEPPAEPPANLDRLPEDVVVDLMRRLDGLSLARLSSCCRDVHAASAALPPLVFAARGRLVVFRSGSSPLRASPTVHAGEV